MIARFIALCLPAFAAALPLIAQNELPLAPSGALDSRNSRASANIRKLVNTQDHIRFTLTGKPGAAGATLAVTAELREGGRWRTIAAPPIRLDFAGSRRIDLVVNTAFQLSDASYPFEKLHFHLSGPDGAAAEIRELRIGSTDELSALDRDEPVVSSSYAAPPPRRVPGLEPIRVYFEFDNRDLARTVRNWPSRVYLPDPNPSGGFRALLLEHADGIVEAAASPAAADVIVYARARRGADPAVAEAVRNGKRLIVYGDAADPEIAALLPLTFEGAPAPGLPRRDTLELAEPDHPVFRGKPRPDSDYGRYGRVRQRDGRVILRYADGDPAMAEKGQIQHWATGLGTAILPSGVFYDRTLLNAVCMDNPAALAALEERDHADQTAEAERRAALVRRVAGDSAAADGWQPGMSDRNVGRFGWLVSDGLFAGGIGRDLTIFNGPHHYRFDDSGRATATLHHWKHRVVSGTATFARSTPADTDPTEPWIGEGVVEYSAELVVNPAWKGRELFFSVEKGIDDLDKTSFNGVPIGKTGKDTPRYWDRPRNYRIDPALVKWGEVNRITVQVTNLRDNAGFGSAPVLLAAAPDSRDAGELCITGVDWVHKSYRLTAAGRSHELDTTLLAPFARHKLSGTQTFLALDEKLARYAAFSVAAGIRIVDLARDPQCYDSARDGAWNAPWLLLFSGEPEAARPLLLVFARPMRTLTATLNGNFVSGFTIDGGEESIGEIAIGWPWGCTPVDASGWTRELPPTALKQIRLGVNFGLNFPIGCDEAFRIDRKKRTVEIRNRFRYKRLRDFWNTPAETLATLPPLTGFAVRQGRYATGDGGPLEDLGVNGEHGPLLARRNTDLIGYTLPLPPEDDIMLVDTTGERELRDKLNMFFSNGVKWSRGGRVPCEAFTPEYPEGENFDPETWTIPLQNWMYKLSSSLQGYLLLDDTNRMKLLNRVRDRFMAPVEAFQYKSCYLHRQEPFSGLRYPVHFIHSTRNNTPYAPGLGSPVVIGDAGEGCAVIAWGARQLADSFGQRNWVRNNWSFFKYAMRYSLTIDDYAFHASTCREFGGGSYIDMLNAEYAAMLHYAQIARTAGDPELSDELFYRAAKRGIPTLMRLGFTDYIKEAMPQVGLDNVAVCTGFSEDHLPLLRFPTNNGNFLEANDLFDLSQGFPGALYHLYQRHARPEIADYVNNRALPLLRKGNNMLTGYLQPMALYADADFPMRTVMDETLERCRRPLLEDCPGMKVNYLIGLYLWRTGGQVMLREFRDLVIREGVYNPDTAQLTLEFDAGPEGRLVLAAPRAVESVACDGRSVAFLPVPGGAELPVRPGKNRFVVRFSPTSNSNTEKTK